MHLPALPANFFEIFFFSLAVLAFVLAVRFFIQSQKRLKALFPQTKTKRRRRKFWFDRDGFIVPSAAGEQKAYPPGNFTYKVLEREEETREEIRELKTLLHGQQLELTRVMRQMDTLTSGKEEETVAEEEEETYNEETGAATEKVEALQLLLQKKETELQDLRQQSELTKNIRQHFEQVQSGYEELQQKVQGMEQQAWQAAHLATQLDSLEQSHEQLEKSLARKEERVGELSTENARLHELNSQAENQLSEALLQRQQLIKKVHFLEEINSDLQQMTEANRKLKNGLRRVTELESMLSLITEERDVLLKRRN